MYKYVYISGIEKQFRIVGIHPEYYDYQRIFRRPDPKGPSRVRNNRGVFWINFFSVYSNKNDASTCR